MSIHSSLRQTGGKLGAMRNVLKRHERIRYLMTKGTWTDEQSAFGLPKIKQQKIKARKAAPKEAAAAGTEADAAAAEAAPAAATKSSAKPAK